MTTRLQRLVRWFRGPGPRPVAVDRAARAEMARLVRALATGRITNFTFDDAADRLADPAGNDPALWDVYVRCWECYCDVREHTLEPLDAEARRVFARMILFLRSEEPYCWRKGGTIKAFGPGSMLLDALMTLILGKTIPVAAALRIVLWWLARRAGTLIPPRDPDFAAETGVWPFADAASLAHASQTDRLLAA